MVAQNGGGGQIGALTSVLGGEPPGIEERKPNKDMTLVMSLMRDPYSMPDAVFSPILDRGHAGIFCLYADPKSSDVVVVSHFD